MITEKQLNNKIKAKLSRVFGVGAEDADKHQILEASILTVKDILTEKRELFRKKIKQKRPKRISYLCMEFLIGKSLRQNLINLGIEKEFDAALSSLGFDPDEIYMSEPDAALGNGGLGRLAACFMDSLTALGYSAIGHSICYEYGHFKQRIVDGMQAELPDIWLPEAGVWLTPRADKTVTVRFNGRVSEKWEHGALNIVHEDYDEVEAVPYDMQISGYDSEAVNILRLWRARDKKNFNMNLFSQGQYIKALEESNNAEIISKILYPSDNHTEGKLLRLRQQYFLVSATIQSTIADHLAAYGTLANFPEKNALHINDTHPALCIPELMRILLDNYRYSWEDAWSFTVKCLSYTNHTVMPEALECWNEEMFKVMLPRIYMIVNEINRRFCQELWNIYPGDWDRISRMSIIGYSSVRMANLSVVGSHTVNGVSKMHSKILKESIFRDFSNMTPEKFTNITNGIAHRRWLCLANPALASLLDDCIGSGYRKNPEELEKFIKFKDDTSVKEAVENVKKQNKLRFAEYLMKYRGISVNCDSVFDFHAKRLHEYKRQLLNVLNIISVYSELQENPDADILPQTFFFAAKAAPGYQMAKDIIRLICCLASEIEKDKKISEKLKVVFLEDYNVSLAEQIVPASDISEQISLAGKEASGTGNMKFMINGALTVCTLDGANDEMFDILGKDHIFAFGLSTVEVDDLWRRGYNSSVYYNANKKIKSCVDRLNDGFNGVSFSHIADYLLRGYGVADPYMTLADFESYHSARAAMLNRYRDRQKWNSSAIVNIGSAGYFAADRSIREYAENIWNAEPVCNE